MCTYLNAYFYDFYLPNGNYLIVYTSLKLEKFNKYDYILHIYEYNSNIVSTTSLLGIDSLFKI